MTEAIRPKLQRFELSVRRKNQMRGGPVMPVVRDSGLEGSGAHNILLLVHGFNNNESVADERFETFTKLIIGRIGEDGRAIDAIARFQWPGDLAVFGPWPKMDFLGYPADIGQAKRAAIALATFLSKLLANRSTQPRLCLVGHSLGCRLILEAFHAPALAGSAIRVDYLCMFAAAGPVALTERGCRLAAPPVAPHRLVNCYSEGDWVLRLGFPAGQTLGYVSGEEEAAYLEAIGLHGSPASFGVQERTENSHGEYWGDTALADLIAAAIEPTKYQKPAPKIQPRHSLPMAQLPIYRAPARSLPA